MAFRYERFAAWAATELPGGRSPETVKKQVERLALLETYGFSPDAFLLSPRDAEEEIQGVLGEYVGRGHPHHHRSLVKALNWLALYAAARDARFRGVRWPLPHVVASEPYLLTDEQVLGALEYEHRDAVCQARRRALAWVGCVTGLRRSEVGAMRVSHLDAGSGTARIESPRKRGVPRLVPLPSAAWRPNGALQGWLRVRPRLVIGQDWLWTHAVRGVAHRRTGAALAGHDLAEMGDDLGYRLTFTAFRQWCARLRRRAGLTDDHIGALYGHNSNDSPRAYSGGYTWQQLSTAMAEAGLPGYRRYPKDLPDWLPRHFT